MEETELCFPRMFNSSCRRPKRPYFEVMLVYTALSFISVLTVILNLLVIVAISHFRQLHTPTNVLLLSLAVSDFLVGLLMFFQIILINGCWFLGDIICVLYQYLAYTITAASITTMVLISVDRYVAICYPLQYSTRMTQKLVKLCVCVCWSGSVIFQCVILKDDLQQPGRYNSCYGECIIVINYVVGFVDMTFNLILPITVIVVLYVRIFTVAAAQARAMRSQVAAPALHGPLTRMKSELKAARTLGVVVVVFLLCMCPYFCVAITGQDQLLNASSATFVIYLIYFNSCLNPIIYAFFYPWFRKSIKLIVTLGILLPDSCDINVI
ncbi:trace amine-associated receptor 13c-like [Poecilia latipinna]|uniref:trace amine-associated receptor 13c-like n=1 Tax=Poecilia latipinna TaxID=48699 RepID=UPI00072E089F|nr:PREDICTED: trace amine-associated receptor 13c-like [Poecilia latipinna]